MKCRTALIVFSLLVGSAVAADNCSTCRSEKFPPWVCPLFPIMDDLFYANSWDPTCLDDPTATYLMGDWPYPLDCGDNRCADGTRKAKPGETARTTANKATKSLREFPGLPNPLPSTYEHKFPFGTPTQSVIRIGSRPRFITFNTKATGGIEARPVIAKHFEYAVNVGSLQGKEPRWEPMHLAFEVKSACAGYKPIQFNDGDAKYPVPYSGAYAYTLNAKVVSILALVSVKPPVDGEGEAESP